MRFINVNYYSSGAFKPITISPDKIETMEECREPKGVQTDIAFESGTQFKVAQSISEIIARVKSTENV